MNQTSVYTPISSERIVKLSFLATRVGARIYIVRQVPVDQGCDWNKAINLIGPDTRGTCFVRGLNISEQYPPVSDRKEEFDIILFSNLDQPSDDKMLSWVQEANVINTNPREVFAIGQRYKNFNTSIYRQVMSINCLSGCSFIGLKHICFLSYTRSHFSSRIGCCSIGLRTRDFLVSENDWFAFRESAPEPVQ